ncbi:hypothetical protein MMC07_009260, partial [Pseudocyphellaria aurata]|nr:hypothetical protein [Pseudocyphellaria aurata]
MAVRLYQAGQGKVGLQGGLEDLEVDVLEDRFIRCLTKPNKTNVDLAGQDEVEVNVAERQERTADVREGHLMVQLKRMSQKKE